MEARTGKMIAAGMVLCVACPCVGLGVMVAASGGDPAEVDAEASPPWTARLASCARSPENVGRAVESGRLTTAYDCAPGTLWVTHGKPLEWRYDAPDAPVAETFGARLLARESKSFQIVAWYAVDRGPIAGAILRYITTRETGMLELQVMSRAHVVGNPYGMTAPTEVAAEAGGIRAAVP